MDRDSGITASELIKNSSVDEISDTLYNYGEVRNSIRMARVIKESSDAGQMETTGDLKRCLEAEYGQNLSYKVLSMVFQSLRIAVNSELDELETFLSKAVERLSIGGRLVVIAYHSLEDRIVKNFIREMEKDCICPPDVLRCNCEKVKQLKRISRKAIKPTEEELANNSRSRSARLRVAERVEG